MDPGFVREVLTEGIKILNNCELYSKYQDERNARFKVTPRKVTEVLSDALLKCICVLLYTVEKKQYIGSVLYLNLLLQLTFYLKVLYLIKQHLIMY